MLGRNGWSAMLASTVLVLGASNAATAQHFAGGVELGYWNTDRDSTDTDIVGSPFNGISVGGFLTTTFGGDIRATLDGKYEAIDDENLNDVYESGPVHTGVIGLHLGKSFGDLYVGAFGGVGYFDGYDSNSPMDGRIYGVEAEYQATQSVNVFAQLGRAKAIGDPGDNEFRGVSTRVGASAQLTDRLTATAAYEYAKSNDCFEDCGGDWGRYRAIGVDVAYKYNDTFDIFGGIENQSIVANTEDQGDALNIFVGVRATFGGSSRRNNLATPMGAFNAAGWMEPLD